MPRITSSEHFRRHQFLRLIFQDQSLQIFCALLDLTKQFDLHEYYATDRDYGEEEFLEHRKELDATHSSMRSKVGKSFKLIEDAFIAASRAHGVTDEQRQEVVRRRRSPAPAYASVSEAKRHESKRGGERTATSRSFPSPSIDKKKLVRAILALARWRMETLQYVPDNSKAAVRSTPILQPVAADASSSSLDRRRIAHPVGSTTSPASSAPQHPPAAEESTSPDTPERAAA
jgi:alkylhydroperoxidase family enzyme